ncbi:DNA-directed RNA polymerase III subunit RPC9-like [Saccostrea cucullata]|uniref:DNA-directed RNA polymerase III subunit RPC9-like n=1 Tax=Saccostrea cuccullata TaxID=36930 RepID=UPI002ED46923
MEVVRENSAMLSNFEVYSLLTDIQAGRGQNKPNKQQQQLATITYETIKYLETKPCKNQTQENITEFMKELEPYSLTRAEKLQILNLCPTTAVEIQLIVEESEERLTEEQIYGLLEIIAKYNPTEGEQEEDTSGEIEPMNE